MNAADGLWKAGQSKNCMHGLHHSSAHPSLRHESPVAERGLAAGKWGLEHGPRQETAVGCEKTT